MYFVKLEPDVPTVSPLSSLILCHRLLIRSFLGVLCTVIAYGFIVSTVTSDLINLEFQKKSQGRCCSNRVKCELSRVTMYLVECLPVAYQCDGE